MDFPTPPHSPISVTSRRTFRRASVVRRWIGLAGMIVAALPVVIGATPAQGDEATAAKVTRLNKQALDAFDNLNFDQAKTLLEQALSQSDSAGLGNDPVAARTHLNLGMLLIAGFQDRNQAREHFRAALKIEPGITAPAGLFNPEVQEAFDEVKATAKSEAEAREAAQAVVRSRAEAAAAKRAAVVAPPLNEAEEGEEEDEGAADDRSRKLLLSVALGSGLGIAKGQLDANRDLDSNGDEVPDNSWSGGVAPSRLGHFTLAGGYFLSPDLLLSLEGRLQIVTGPTVVKGVAGSGVCEPSCAAPSTALAAFAKASWFLSRGPLRPFLSGGIGAGRIRQVVKLNIGETPGLPAATGCGESGTATCVDTVSGGPFWLAAGGGLAYELGQIALLAWLTANVGMPDFMFNVDALFGLGLRL